MNLQKPNYEKYPNNLISVHRDEVLFEYTCLTRCKYFLFTNKPKYGHKLLFYIVDEDENIVRYIASSTHNFIINELKNCTRSILNAIIRSQMWLVDINTNNWTVKNAWILKKEDIFNYELPNSDVMLYSE